MRSYRFISYFRNKFEAQFLKKYLRQWQIALAICLYHLPTKEKSIYMPMPDEPKSMKIPTILFSSKYP